MELTVGATSVGPLVLLSGRIGLAGDSDAAVGGMRQRRLLAGLAVRRGQIVTADWLTDVVWYGEDPPDAAPSTIRTYVYRLRKALGDNVEGVRLETIGGSYRLDCPAGSVDVDGFAAHAAAANAAHEAGDPGLAVVEADRALRLWRGEPFGEFAGEPWAVAAASRLREVHAVVEERRASALIASSRLEEAIAELEGLVQAQPLRERRVELLARSMVRAGRQGDALRQIAQLRERLRDEQGLDPSTAIVDLERRILADDESLLHSSVLRTIRSFEITEQLAAGADWTAWRGQHPSLDHEVLLKSFGAHVADDPGFVRNFEPRLRQVSRLEHPAIVAVEDYWREPGSAHVVTRILRGPHLEACLSGSEPIDVRLDDIVEQIGGALAAAHSDGVVHGAIGPRAVASDHLGNWYLTDFANVEAIIGTATALDDLERLAALLRTVAVASGTAVDVVPEHGDDDINAFLAELQRRARPKLRAPSISDRRRVSRNPYPGLRSFDDSERRLFFGREALVEQVLGGMSDDLRFAVIIGPSGTGKSSLLHAGVIPSLTDTNDEQLLVARLTPGHDPFDRLATALASVSTGMSAVHIGAARLRDEGVVAVVRDVLADESGLVIAVDQLEELFTLAGGDPEASSFIGGLFAVATEPGLPVRVLVTLRSDHFGGLLTSEPVAASLQRSLVPVPPFTAAQLQSVITGPAHLAGVDVEARLASALVAELADRPSLLPHLQHMLRHLFEARDGSVLTYSSYESAGGVTGALGRTGEQLYSRLSMAEAHALRRIFRRLSHIDAEGEVSRRRVDIADLARTPESNQVLRRLGEERLVVFDHDPQTRAPTVEITHEAIFRAWPRLAEWLREDSDVARLLEDLDDRSRAWLQLNRESGELLHGLRLERALEAMPTIDDELSQRERDYVEASRLAHEEALVRDVRRRKRLRVSLVLALIGLIASASAGLYAMQQRTEAEDAAAAAQQAADAADVSRQQAQTQAGLADDAARLADEQRAVADRRLALGSVRQLLDDDPRLGLLLSTGLYDSDPSFETLSLLQEALVGLPRGLEAFFGDGVPYEHVSLSPDGATVAGLTRTHLEVWDSGTGELRLRMPAPAARDMVISSSDAYVVDDLGSVSRTSFDGGVKTDLDTPFSVRSIALAGAQLAIGGDDGGISYAPIGAAWAELSRGMATPADRVHVSADGRFLVATSLTVGSPAMIWNLETGEFVGSHGHRGPHGIQHTTDAIVVGDSLASIGPNRGLEIRSLPDMALRAAVQYAGTHLDPIDDESFLVVGESGWLSVRSLVSGAELDRFVGTATQRSSEASVSADGTSAVLGTGAGIELWSLEGGRGLPDSVALADELQAYSPEHTQRSPGGLYPIVRTDVTNPGLIMYKDGEPTALWDQAELPTAISMRIFDDMGMVIVSDLSLRFVAFDGDTITTLPDLGLNGLSESDGWAADRFGDTIAVVTGRTDSRIAIVERTGPDTIELVRLLRFDGPWPYLGFSSDGQYLLAGSSGTSTVWDTTTWDVVRESDDQFDSRPVGITNSGDDETLVLTIDGKLHRTSISSSSILSTQQLSAATFPIYNWMHLLRPDLLLTAAPSEVGGAARLWDLDELSQIGVSFPALGDGSSLHAENELMTLENDVHHIWPLDIDTWPDHACRIAGRGLTPGEWEEHGPTGAEFEPVCTK